MVDTLADIGNSAVAPAERSLDTEIAAQMRHFLDNPHFAQLYDTVPDPVMILNRNRQIVFANQALLAAQGVTREQFCGGARPGELLGCDHADDSAFSGCGTTAFCVTCGAVQAILSSLAGRISAQECRITRGDGDPLDLYVWASPLEENGEPYSVVVLKDISHQKRRQALEKVFFHDVLNVVNNIVLSANLLNEGIQPEDDRELRQNLVRFCEQLTGEIDAQRSLAEAETNELVIHPAPLKTMALMESVLSLHRWAEYSAGKSIVIDPGSADVMMVSDIVLLKRIVGNMVKNAVEASSEGDTVTLSCTSDGAMVGFSVHNPAVMPKQVQLQVFQRSFSTKGVGRGLGTFSIKLLSERYLGGSVSFSSAKGKGTTFRAVYPMSVE